MAKEHVCPRCGVSLSPDDMVFEISAPRREIDPAQTVEEVIPATLSFADQPLAPSLRAGFALATSPAVPEEAGTFVAGDTIATPEPGNQPPPPEPSNDGVPETVPPVPTLEPPLESAAPAFPVRLDAETPAVAAEPVFPSLEAVAPAATPAESPRVEEEVETTGPGIGFVLLASYASAMTLACLWLVWQARHRDLSSGPDSLPVDSRPDDRSGRLTVIPEDRTTTVGKPLRIGDLTLTPLRATLGQVTLEAAKPNGGGEKKQGAEGSILLTLSLQNQSPGTTFAPLELAFLRTPDAGSPASFIESESGPIDLYPLAEASEWRIVGQDIRALKPGESMRTLIASKPTAARNLAGTLRLRLKLHPTPGTTNVVHIDIDGDSLQ